MQSELGIRDPEDTCIGQSQVLVAGFGQERPESCIFFGMDRQFSSACSSTAQWATDDLVELDQSSGAPMGADV